MCQALSIGFYICLFCFFTVERVFAQEVVLNEIMSSNATILQDEDGDYSDWIELYNSGDEPVNVGGFSISDNLAEPTKWAFPEVWIDGQSTIVIYASGKDRTSGSHLHTNFKIDSDGEIIIFSDADGNVLDYWPPVELETDLSYGRFPDGAEVFETYSGPTPNLPNSLGEIYVPPTDTIFFSSPPGFYTENFLLNLTCTHPDATIHYTFNGKEPTWTDAAYSGAITINDNAMVPNGISTIPTNTPETYVSAGWKPPADTVFKATVIKARGFVNNQPVTKTRTSSYFVHTEMNDRYNGLPIVSLSIDSLHLFSYETGIYVPGQTHDNSPEMPIDWGYGNYNMKGKEWERPAHLEFFEGNGDLSLSQGVGVRIHGGGTRQLSVKSLRLYARNQYGRKYFDYPFFPWKPLEKYRRIILRPSGNNYASNYCADAVSSIISDSLHVLKQEFRPAVLFINGEFWGIHHIRERIDKYFLEYTSDADPDEVDLIENWMEASEGSMAGYQDLVDFIEGADMAYDLNYETAAGELDIHSIIDYYILKQYIAVHDWPGNNNSFWRSTNPQTKWQWINYDSDGAFETSDYDPIEPSLVAAGTYYHSEISVFLFKNLMRNAQFKELYYQRFLELMNTIFKPESIVNIIDSVTTMFAPVMEEHIRRWQYPSSYQVWEESVQIMRDFAYQRPCYMLSYLISHLSVHPSEYPAGICDEIFPVQEPLNEIVLWPNPANHQLNIKLPNDSEFRQIRILDAAGRVVLNRTQGLQKFADQLSIPLDDFASGIYIVDVSTENDVFQKRVIISHP